MLLHTPQEEENPQKKAAIQPVIATTTTPSQQPILTPSTQPRLRKPQRTEWQKADDILATITKDFRSLGYFLEVLFYNRISGVPDPRMPRHVRAVAAFLGGESNVTMATIINLIYNHRQSRPPKDSPENSLHFSPTDVASPLDINHARPALSTWALQTVGPELRRQVGGLKMIHPILWIQLNCGLPLTAGPKMYGSPLGILLGRSAFLAWQGSINGGLEPCVIVLRKRRPHNAVQVGAISCLTLSRNRYASGYLALPLAVWQFACKTHVDEKRVFSRFGFTVHDTTARACLDSLTDTSMAKLRASVAEGIANGTMCWQLVLDNVQQYCRQRDHRLGRQDVLKVGTAATAILLEDCAPGAFDLQDHLDRVMQQERRQLNIDSLYTAIDRPYIHELTALHWVRILVYFIPQLAYLRQDVTAAFNSAQMTKHRLPRGRIAIWIFNFSGSTNRNYANYLLETYCLHRYEASPDFSNAMFNNWLLSTDGKKYIELDWVQEDYNKWLEELVEHKGGDFDDHFYRHTLAPNSTAYSDITKDVLSGEEHDNWDVEMQRRVDEMLHNLGADSDEEPESDSESESGDDSGDITIRGMDYSDDESETSDDEENSPDLNEQDEPEEDFEGQQENEELSEMEEEEMDRYQPPVEDAGFESDN
ncbi:hypothetical protein B0H13DRAFT_2300950 [Mycena leptocephala]|nr:hypothetical protein B0H13DRAFT_2300950 [Mycena leptocephala]